MDLRDRSSKSTLTSELFGGIGCWKQYGSALIFSLAKVTLLWVFYQVI